MNWRIVLAIARKDVVDAVKNLYILFCLVLPMGMWLIWRLIIPIPDELGALTVAVYDPGSSRLVAGLRALSQVQVLDATSAEQLPKMVEEQAVGGLAVPAGFDAAVDTGEQPELTVYLNRRRGGGGVVAFQRLVEQQVWAMVGQEFPARLVTTDVAAPPGMQDQGGLRFDYYLLVLLLVMALAMTGAFVVPTLLVEEKEKHTLEALLVSPAGPAEVVTGKALTGLVYSLLIAGVLIALNQGWVGNWPITALAVLLGSLFLVAVGLLMGALFRTTMQVNTWASLVMLTLMAPSWFTILQMPAPLEAVMRLLPTYYLTAALGLALAGEASLARVWGDLAVLLGSVIVTLAAVVWVLRRESR